MPIKKTAKIRPARKTKTLKTLMMRCVLHAQKGAKRAHRKVKNQIGATTLNLTLSLFVGLVIAGLFCTSLYVFADPPSSPFSAPAPLNPECGPSDTNCTVSGSSQNPWTSDINGGGFNLTNLGYAMLGAGTYDGSSTLQVNGVQSFGDGAINITNDGTSPSIQIGYSASATGSGSTALGYYATSSGYTSVALGNGATADRDSSTALGSSAYADGYYSTALGVDANASGQYSIALGSSAFAPNDNEINFSNDDSSYGTLNSIGGYTQLDINYGVADFQGNSINTTGYGMFGSGTYDGSSTLQVNGNITQNGYQVCDMSGNCGGSSWTFDSNGIGYTDSGISFTGGSSYSGLLDGSNELSVIPQDRVLVGPDGSTQVMNWNQNTGVMFGSGTYDGYSTLQVNGAASIYGTASILGGYSLFIADSNFETNYTSTGVTFGSDGYNSIDFVVKQLENSYFNGGGSAAIDWSGVQNSSAALSFDSSGNSYFSQGLTVSGVLTIGTAVSTPGDADLAFNENLIPAGSFNLGTPDNPWGAVNIGSVNWGTSGWSESVGSTLTTSFSGHGAILTLGYVNSVVNSTLQASGGIITKDNASYPTLSCGSSNNGMIQVAKDGSAYKLAFCSQGVQKYITSTGSFYVPGEETTDSISGTKMQIGDYVVGLLDQNVGDSDNSIHGSWVKLSSVLAELEQTNGNLSILNGSGAIGGGAVSGVNSLSVQSSLASMGAVLTDGVMSLGHIIASNASFRTADITQVNIQRMQMVDQVTGQVYCTWLANGEWQKMQGDCDNVAPAVKIADTLPTIPPATSSGIISTNSIGDTTSSSDNSGSASSSNNAQTLNIVSVASIPDINVPYGTALASVGLPATVTATLSDNSEVSLDVTWNDGAPAYDLDTAGTYIFDGTLTVSSSVTNTNNVGVVANVIVTSNAADVTSDVIQNVASGLLNGVGNFIKYLFGSAEKAASSITVIQKAETSLSGSIQNIFGR